MPSWLPLRLPRAIVVAAMFACGIAEAGDERIAINVDKSGQRVDIDVVVHADVPVSQAWAVFTDYEAMPGFLKSVTRSSVLRRDGNMIVVEQSGMAKIAFMHFGFHTVRSVELSPMREIRSTQISGDFKEYASTTTFAPTEHGVRIHHRGNYVPKNWLPPMIGPSIIESETRKQYEQFLLEIERRAVALRPKPPS